MLKMEQNEKISKYSNLLTQIKELVTGVEYGVSSLANVSSLLHKEMNFFWTGFYLVSGNNLLLGPFQGDLACIKIPFGKGVCGTAWQKSETIIVDDVEKFPGHIACSALSKSEIVVPVFNNSGKITAVLDIDSENFSTFDQTDKTYLEQIVGFLSCYDKFV